MNGLLQGLRALGPTRIAALGVVAAGLFGLIVFLAIRAGQPPMALLYADLDTRDSAAVVQSLERQRVPYRLEGNGGRILVPVEQVARVRLALASEGLPTGGSVGYELFDRTDSLTTSSFQQGINQVRALEGELARTIRQIQGVRAVRVHLVLPRREPFARQQAEAQASIVLTMAGPQRLDREQVQAIVHLAAAAVPGLKPANISVVDSRGSLLARGGQAVTGLGVALNAEEVRRAHELRLSRAVEELLERTLGVGKVRVEATVEMDFDRITESRESFDPDQQVARSTSSITEQSRGQERQQNVTVGNNLPNPEPQNAGSITEESRTEETTNFEIGRTLRQIVREAPQVRRQSIAVLVDGTMARPEGGGAPVWRPRTAEELAQITALVRGAVGFDEARGDKIEVVNLRFAEADAGVAEEERLFGLPIGRAEIVRIVETAVFGVIALLALLLVVRPLAGRVLERVSPAGGDALAGLPGTSGLPALSGPAAAAAAAALAGPGGQATLPGPDGAVPLLEGDSLINVSQVEGQMRASSLRRIAELAEKHPEEALSVIRSWMAQES
ncbi:flagellar M-ring protein FliF [Elioraea tepida]|uniref:Flagellar M-ring protein n=1 Tax=Elioraea tepida TaxID=2843330 RepID=A0A975YIZ2_9PROT|nr:flagellar basal-body MS-ring/collar protein FliF [Elioraea tepida]QXM24295.1 flagellar M-ring protein FliF [Elioraea tepida]